MEAEVATQASAKRMAPPLGQERLLLALVSVAGASAACADHGDVATVEVLRDYYALLAEACAVAGGRVVKVMGDGVLLAFPPDRPDSALQALRSGQGTAARRWTAFDDRCRVRVRAVTGPVVSASLGPPDEERPDVYGDTLNRLFKAPSNEDFLVLPDREAPRR